MSSILKALRKLEEEKAELGEGGVDISRDILKRSARKPESNFFWPALSTILFLLLIGSGIYYWTVDRSAPVTYGNSITPKTAIKPQSNPEQPVSLDAATVPPVQVAAPPVQVAAPPVQVAAPPVQVAAPPVQVAAPPVQVEPIAFRLDGAPLLKLTGIAYRENPDERMAIINDLPVMQGTAIEGAQLLEIHPDNVILMWKGTTFNLTLNQ